VDRRERQSERLADRIEAAYAKESQPALITHESSRRHARAIAGITNARRRSHHVARGAVWGFEESGAYSGARALAGAERVSARQLRGARGAVLRCVRQRSTGVSRCGARERAPIAGRARGRVALRCSLGFPPDPPFLEAPDSGAIALRSLGFPPDPPFLDAPDSGAIVYQDRLRYLCTSHRPLITAVPTPCYPLTLTPSTPYLYWTCSGAFPGWFFKMS